MKIGILGGGQLALMMIESIKDEDIDFIVVDIAIVAIVITPTTYSYILIPTHTYSYLLILHNTTTE